MDPTGFNLTLPNGTNLTLPYSAVVQSGASEEDVWVARIDRILIVGRPDRVDVFRFRRRKEAKAAQRHLVFG